ncbi:phage tail tape measure protein [Latilactobacillus sakei]|uniref:Phage tail tape measure protein n=1 Tax=Latilactobacillus sakei TaxID=1599 RepID=A0AAF0GRQ6_LATSK|nr:phage tail tape measure protein [Latilactobacillus sakei]WGI18552.1 phage tail tape measure protein [Latilactobacillus sakei]
MANVVATFTANIKPYQAAMDQMKQSTTAATDSTKTAGQRVSTSLTSLGKASTIAGTAVAAMSVKAIKSYGDFQESINQAAVIAGSSNKSLKGDMKALEDEALSLGKTLPINAEEAGQAMVEMARNGASVKDLREEFPAIAKASAVAGAGLSETATTVQQAMNIWGGGAANAAKYSAILAKNANMSNAEVGDMGQAFANVGSTAQTLGISVKDTSTAIGLMSNAGLGAAQGSQDLAHALTLMARPTKVAAGEMDKLGISYTDSAGKFKPFPQILKEVAKATDGMSQSNKIAALTNLYGAAGAKAMLPLLIQTEKKTKSGKTGWDAYSDSLGKVSGTAKSANKYLQDNSQNMTKNVGQSLAQMADAFDAVVKTSIGSIAPQIQAVANALGNFATWLNTSKSPMASFTRQLIAWSPVIAIALVAFGLLSTGLGKLIGAFSAPIKLIKQFKGETSSSAKPIGQSAGQIAAMGAKALGAGVGIGVAAVGFAILALAVAKLAETGTAGLVALAAMTVAITTLMIVTKLVAPTFQKSAVGLLAFGAAVLMVSAGMAILVNSFANFQSAGGNAPALMATIAVSVGALVAVFALLGPALNAGAVGMIAFGVTMLAVTGGLALLVQSFANFQASGGNANQLMIIMAVSVGALAGVFALLGPLLTAGAVGILAFGAAILMIGAGVALATNGIANLLNAISVFTGKTKVGTQATNDFASQSGNSLSSLGSNGGQSISGLASSVSGSMSKMSSDGKGSASGMASTVTGLLGGMSSTGKGHGSALESALNGNFSSMATKAAGSTSDIKGSFGSLGQLSLNAAGQAIMGSFFAGLQAQWGPVMHFVSGIAGWIKDHKGPINKDARLLIPAGNVMMNGLNLGLTSGFTNVQKNVSGMAGELVRNVGDLSTGDLSYAGSTNNTSEFVQPIDDSQKITPTITVHNEIVGDKIRTIVKEGDREFAVKEQYFR